MGPGDSLPLSQLRESARGSKPSKVKSCAECRRLKLKCDRTVPCSNCVRRDTISVCPNGTSAETKTRKRHANEDQRSLQARIALLENALANSTSNGHPPLPQSDETSPATRSMSAQDIERVEVSPARPTGRRKRRRDGKSPSFSTDDAEAARGDTMAPDGPLRTGTTAAQAPSRDTELGGRQGHLQIENGDLSSSRFFGNASSFFFTSHTSSRHHRYPPGSALNQALRPGWIESSMLSMFELDSGSVPAQSLAGLVSQLPPYEHAVRLVGIYFDTVAWSTGILDEVAFAQDVFDRFYGEGEKEPQRLAILFFTLALGSLFDPMSPLDAAVNTYTCELFAQGRASLSLNPCVSVKFVQAIDLMIVWLTNGGRFASSIQSTWPLLGHAIRSIQALGLHRDGENFDLPKTEVEERRRVFWEVFVYDVSQALYTGRPRGLTAGTYDVKLPETRTGGDRDMYQECRYKLATFLCRVSDEHSRVVSSPYDEILQLDRDIRQFQNELPEEVVSQTPPRNEKISQPTHDTIRHAMRFRISSGLLMLHRAWFMRALFEKPQEPLQSTYRYPLREGKEANVSFSYVGAIEACKGMLDVLKRLSSDDPEVCNRKWWFFFLSFSACVCLAAAVIRAPLSLLAQSSLLALDEGISLFQQAGKQEELTFLVRLQTSARKVYSQGGREEPADAEDVSLLGGGPKKADYTTMTGASQSPVARSHEEESRGASLPAIVAPPWAPSSNLSGSSAHPLISGTTSNPLNQPDSVHSSNILHLFTDPSQTTFEAALQQGASNQAINTVNPHRIFDNFECGVTQDALVDFDFESFLRDFDIQGQAMDPF